MDTNSVVSSISSARAPDSSKFEGRWSSVALGLVRMISLTSFFSAISDAIRARRDDDSRCFQVCNSSLKYALGLLLGSTSLYSSIENKTTNRRSVSPKDTETWHT